MSEPEETTYYLYMIDYWERFPTSEYGGIVLVTAKSKEDAIQVLLNSHGEVVQYRDFDDKFEERIKENVEEAKYFALKGEHKSEVVKYFIT